MGCISIDVYLVVAKRFLKNLMCFAEQQQQKKKFKEERNRVLMELSDTASKLSGSAGVLTH